MPLLSEFLYCLIGGLKTLLSHQRIQVFNVWLEKSCIRCLTRGVIYAFAI